MGARLASTAATASAAELESRNEIADHTARLNSVFFPRASQAIERIRDGNLRLAHYTSAEAAYRIIQNEEFWMRKSTAMNDFLEVHHGWDCLKQSYSGDSGKRLHAILDRFAPTLRTRLEALFNGHIDGLLYETYLGCFSLHKNDEDEFGRLSMWRAYGRGSTVALILNNTPFASASDAFGRKRKFAHCTIPPLTRLSECIDP